MVAIKRRQQGFTYLSLVILLAIMGLVGAAALKVDALLARAAAEEELLEVGAAFSAALDSYAAATPQGKPPQPPTLQDLLKDTRFPGIKRHLRKIFVDPVSGKAEWGITYLGDKVGVIGVYSLSQAQPLKLANFDARFQNFENKTHYAEWKFVAKDQGGLERINDTKLPAVMPPAPVAPALVPAAPAPVAPAPEPEAAPEPPPEPAPSEPPEEPEQR